MILTRVNGEQLMFQWKMVIDWFNIALVHYRNGQLLHEFVSSTV